MSNHLFELIQKYDIQGPRYTSYPTAPHWTQAFSQKEYQEKLQSLAGDKTLALYTHIPFCEEKCYFCACNVVITRKKEQADLYLKYLKKELSLLGPSLPSFPVTQIHWGGGTPTYLTCEQMEEYFREVEKYFSISPSAEISLELDPRVTTLEQLKTLRRLGFNRVSMGVQDFDPKVQEAIHRHQTEEQTRQAYEWCRELDFSSVNMDFVYGLPFQTRDSFEKNLKMIVALRPDRLAFYNYAHVPWHVSYQKFIPEHALPGAQLKVELFETALAIFKEAQYLPIGLDHFAKSTDELIHAFEAHTLRRNFMGYTTQKESLLLAFGVSSISDVEDIYAQNFRKLSDYYKALDENKWPIMKGHWLTADDQLRRQIIMELMCHLEVPTSLVSTLEQELLELKPMVQDGFLEITSEKIRVTELGRVFLRNICMVFDAYLSKETQATPQQYSRTI
ncbi:MAG: oxygen-independent coproporphyrinogen III oxidase [Deltaproteobacteria bacterium]|nr:oxygen-independent coproporphyrinogen III oxidase [Deltaproteobacteria bacterium]